jgi:hypothetical protein
MNKNNNNLFSNNSNTDSKKNQGNQQQEFSQSVSRALDQTKDNINRSIEESRIQIPHYNTIVSSYQGQTLQVAREISEN